MADHTTAGEPPEFLCASAELAEGGMAVAFDVLDIGVGVQANARTGLQALPLRAFAIRFESKPHAYLNRCSHVAMEMDWQPNRFFDDTGQWLLCASHGAAYLPDTGACAGGPCQGGLVKIPLLETGGKVHWQPGDGIAPPAF